ncbi:MAG: hypothetical protein JNN15_08855, partial [Blastocatellia bacterium]|nr:hypothetical protein [Blastocatellia bacterium]
MHIRRACAVIFAILIFVTVSRAQGRLLTLDDIYDPQKRINFSGNFSQTTWLADGKHYLHFKVNPQSGLREFFKVEAATGKSEPFYNEQQ